MKIQARSFGVLAAYLVICLFLSGFLTGCYSSSSQKQKVEQSASAATMAKTTSVKKTYSDIPTSYPDLYAFDPNSGLKNIYDESKVVDWSQAGDYVGQAITVEGDVASVVYSGASEGSPYFFNLGGGAYEGFAVVIWSEDLSRFDQNILRNDVEWSNSGQPLQIRLRVSGVVEMYNGRPQITARDGTQVAEWVNGAWNSMISGSSMDALMDALYR